MVLLPQPTLLLHPTLTLLLPHPQPTMPLHPTLTQNRHLLSNQSLMHQGRQSSNLQNILSNHHPLNNNQSTLSNILCHNHQPTLIIHHRNQPSQGNQPTLSNHQSIMPTQGNLNNSLSHNHQPTLIIHQPIMPTQDYQPTLSNLPCPACQSNQLISHSGMEHCLPMDHLQQLPQIHQAMVYLCLFPMMKLL